MTIQIGPLTKECLERAAPGKFKFKHRGVITLKVRLLVISTRVNPVLKTHRTPETFATKIVVGQLQKMDFNHINE
jgi:hypothetical protein